MSEKIFSNIILHLLKVFAFSLPQPRLQWDFLKWKLENSLNTFSNISSEKRKAMFSYAKCCFLWYKMFWEYTRNTFPGENLNLCKRLLLSHYIICYGNFHHSGWIYLFVYTRMWQNLFLHRRSFHFYWEKSLLKEDFFNALGFVH